MSEEEEETPSWKLPVLNPPLLPLLSSLQAVSWTDLQSCSLTSKHLSSYSSWHCCSCTVKYVVS